VGVVFIALGLTLAAIVASNLPAANARDLGVNTWFWDLGVQNPWIADTAQFFSWFAAGMRNIVVVPLVVIILLIARKWKWAIFLVVVSQGGLLISNALKFSITRERPPFVASDSLQQHLSFPSGHTFSGFSVWIAIAIIAWYLLPRQLAVPVATVLAVIGLLQAPARLVAGRHWLTDVIGSWLIGAGWLLLVWAGFVWWLTSSRKQAASVT
jgi:undecaprenyl-diphosphatase